MLLGIPGIPGISSPDRLYLILATLLPSSLALTFGTR